jgi:hypothetical protein
VAELPENYLTITWKLKAAEEGALLTVTRGDYAKIARERKDTVQPRSKAAAGRQFC